MRKFKLIFVLFLSLTIGLFGAERTFKKDLPLEGIHQFVVENVNGEIRTTPSPDDRLHVEALFKGSPEEVGKMDVEVKQDGDVLTLSVKYPKRYILGFIPVSQGGKADLDIQLPPSMKLHLETVNGSIKTRELKGELTLELVNGSAEVLDHQGKVNAETVNGRLTLQVTHIKPQINAESVNGSITLQVAREASFRYALETVNGTIEVLPGEKSGVHGKKELKGRVGEGEGFIDAETINGSIEIVYI